MADPRVLALVLAGGAGSRLELLTEQRAKPAIPIGGSHRLIDVALSNCAHSRVRDVWVVQQYQPASLTDSLRNGRPWDLDRNHGGLLVLSPGQGGDREGWHQGTADALWKIAPLVRDFDPEVLLVLSADALYRLDYAEVVAGHQGAGVAATMVTCEVESDPARYGVVQVDESDRVTEYAYKPDNPKGSLVSIEVFAFHPGTVLQTLEKIADRDPDRMADLGDALLPTLVESEEVREHRFHGYWRDLGTVPAYWEAHMDLLPHPSRFALEAENWPIRSSMLDLGSVRIRGSAELDNVLVGGGAEVAGRVTDSVIGQGARVEAGATVSRSVILPGAVVRRGATVRRAVIDAGATIGRDSVIGAARGQPALVGRGERVAAGTTLGAGGRLPSKTDLA